MKEQRTRMASGKGAASPVPTQGDSFELPPNFPEMVVVALKDIPQR